MHTRLMSVPWDQVTARWTCQVWPVLCIQSCLSSTTPVTQTLLEFMMGSLLYLLLPGEFSSFKQYQIINLIFRAIAKGQEISDSYGVSFIETPRKVRQRKLLEQYKFKCECQGCQKDFPLFSELDKLLPDKMINGVSTTLQNINNYLSNNDFLAAKKTTLKLMSLLHQSGLPYTHAVYQRCRLLLNTCLRFEIKLSKSIMPNQK